MHCTFTYRYAPTARLLHLSGIPEPSDLRILTKFEGPGKRSTQCVCLFRFTLRYVIWVSISRARMDSNTVAVADVLIESTISTSGVDETEETVLLGATGVHLRIKKHLLGEPGEVCRLVKAEGEISIAEGHLKIDSTCPPPDPEAPSADSDILVDVVRRTYRFRRYPSLCGLHSGGWAGIRAWLLWIIALVAGSFFVAGCAQVSLYFPCTSGYSSVAFKGTDYCVNNDDLSRVVRAGQCRLCADNPRSRAPPRLPADQLVMPRGRLH